MIRAHRIAANALDDPEPLVGWNIMPNVGYVVHLSPGATSCSVLLYNEDATALVASGAALTGAAQPCVLLPQSLQNITMLDPVLGWHLLITTSGTEAPRSIQIAPAVDLPDEVHAVYGDDDLASARATAAIDAASHYIDEVVVSSLAGLGVFLGDVVSVPVDGENIIGQVEAITWTATPDSVTETATIRRCVAIAPEAYVEPDPPMVVDDAADVLADATGSGNVLGNDGSGLTVVAVNGLAALVGAAVDGDGGGSFTIAADGTWSFDPDGDYNTLSGEDTIDTSVTYHASNGDLEAMGTLTVTVRAPENQIIPDERWADVVFCINASGDDGSTAILEEKGLTLSIYGDTQIDTELLDEPVIRFDGDGDYMTLPNSTGTKIESGVFTFDAWVYNAVSGRRGVLGNRKSTDSSGATIGFDPSGNVWYVPFSGTPYAAPYIVPRNELHHLEISVDASRLCRIFVDGVLKGSGTVSVGTASTQPLQIGRERNGGTSLNPFAGSIKSMRLTRGATVRHTADFTPPEYPFPTL